MNKIDNYTIETKNTRKYKIRFITILPSPIPLFNRTPHENHMALDRLRAVSSLLDCANRYRPNGLNLSNKYKITATMCTERRTSNHSSTLKGRRNELKSLLLVFFFTRMVIPIKIKIVLN